MKSRIKTTVACIILSGILATAGYAVTSVIVRQKSSEDLLKGKTDGTIVDSRGAIRLAPQTEKLNLDAQLEDVWTINTVLADKTGTIYAGTSPHGKILRFRDGKADVLYPKEPAAQAGDPNAVQETVQPGEHVFAMAFDVAGRVLAGISGQKGKLLRISAGTETLFENEKVQYFFAIALDRQNNIYLGTGPHGQLWRLDAFGQNPKMICQLEDKNILSLAMGENDVLYAGTDSRGVIYRIDLKTEKVSVLFDSEQEEITALVFSSDGRLFAAASSAEIANRPMQQPEAVVKKAPGRPDTEGEELRGRTNTAGGTSLKPANSKEQKIAPRTGPQRPPRIQAPKSVGYIYQITSEGFVTAVFEEPAIFYTLIQKDNRLLLGTGPQAKLFSIDPKAEESSILFEDKTSSQITAATFDGKDVFVALANPAAIVRVRQGLLHRGVYTSSLIDARQPAHWGKIQLDADIPDGCEIGLETRSGNVEEPNDATFSAWSKEVKMTAPVDAGCPVGRFCQYRLTLKTADDKNTPVVREISIAQAIPNLEPKVRVVAAQKTDKQKPYMLTIAARAEDDNKDILEFAFEFRKLGRKNWILLKDKLEEPKYDWDSRTVEDGRYELRVTANDRLSNNEDTALSNSRVSDPIVIDNTAPAIAKADVKIEGTTARLDLTVKDEWSVVGKVQYTVDSDTSWKSVLPDDSVYDTMEEKVAIIIPELSKGEHVIAVRVADDLDNTAYKSYVVEIK